MPHYRLLLPAALAAVVAVSACSANTSGLRAVVATPAPTETVIQPSIVSAATSESAPPAECAIGLPASLDALATLEANLLAAMDGYDGTWSAAVIDLGCGTELAVNPDYTQYTASAAKIVVIVAVLRAVEQGRLDMPDVAPLIEEVMWHSSDWAADALNELIEPEEVAEVLSVAEVSEATAYPYWWNGASMPAIDLARVWAALLDGSLLGHDLAAYLLDRASEADIPDGLETFPPPAEIPQLDYGQKAGYYVSDGIPYFFVGAGFLRPEDHSHPGFAITWIGTTMNEDFLDAQRRSVFPIMLGYVESTLAG
ncbi:MAG TPA: serine hydrolase [Tepidiformaceae bacterium]|nr:serine hydrolase [Tepidiformaceae bacterium]